MRAAPAVDGRARLRRRGLGARRACVGLRACVVRVAPLEPGTFQRARGRGDAVICVALLSFKRRDTALQGLDGDGVAAARGCRLDRVVTELID